MRFSRFALALAALALPLGLASGSCNLVLDNFEKVPATVVVEDAGTADAEPDGPEVCKSVTYPPPPTIDDDGGMIDFTAAVRTIDFGESASADAPVGIDLDNICTCLGEGASCLYPKYATQDHCDDKGGVDNASARILASVAGFIGPSKFGSQFYSDKAEEGFWTLLVRVSGYNGQPNDRKVRFALYSPQGLESSNMAGGGSCTGAGGGPPTPVPCWNGEDVWGVADSSITPGGTIDNPIYVDDNAYVSDSMLVANVSDATISLGGGVNNYMSIKLTAGTIVGTLENPAADMAGWRFKSGTVSGRWRTSDVFSGLATFTAQGQTLCTSAIGYSIFKSKLCEYVDISSKLGGATLECDSVSFAMNFSAFPAKLGKIVPTSMPAGHCTPETDPKNDTCDNP